MRILTLLAVMMMTAGQMWARGGDVYVNTGTVEGGTLTFYKTYKDNMVDNNNTFAMRGETVYIEATPDVVHTVEGMIATNFTVVKSGGTNVAQARRRSGSNNPSAGVTITVTQAMDGETPIPGVFCFTMPDDGANVFVSATFPDKDCAENVAYIDKNGEEQSVAKAYILTGSETVLGVDGHETWYVCNSSLSYPSELTLKGDVNLIIADDCTMTVSSISGDNGDDDYDLVIYGQAPANGDYLPGNCKLSSNNGLNDFGSFTVNSGSVTAGTGIYASSITINGGQVNSGGMLYASSITLGWNNANDFIKASSYEKVSIASGKRFYYVDATVNILNGTISNSEVSALADLKLRPLDGYLLTMPNNVTADEDNNIKTEAETPAATPYYKYEKAATVTLSYGGTGLVTLGGLPSGTTLNVVANQPMQRTFTMPAEDFALTATAVTGLEVSGTYPYDGTAQTPFFKIGDDELNTTDYTVAFKQNNEDVSEAKNAGTYDVILTGLGQYLGTATLTGAFTIEKADYDGTKTASATVRSGQITTDATLTLPDLPDGASYAAEGTVGENTSALIDGTPSVSGTTLTYSTTSQNDGTSATITIAVTGATNYNDYDVVVTVTAQDKDDAGVTINGGEDKTVSYGADDFTLAKTVTTPGTGTGIWTWTSSDTDVATIGESTGTVTIKKVGTTTIKAQYESDTTIGEASIQLKVDAMSLGISWNTDGLVYDGTPKAPTATLSGVKSGDECTLNISVEGDHTAVGTGYTATATLSGAAAGNYTLPKDKKTQTFNIARKPVTVTGITANNKEYDGKTSVTLNTANASISGKVGEENVTVDASAASGIVADKNVGTGKAVTVTGVKLGGTDADNYTLSDQPSDVTVTIMKATVTVTGGITASNKTYDGKTSATLSGSGATIDGMVQGDNLTVTATGTFSDKNVGTGKTVTISGITLGGTDKGNYTLASTGNQATTSANIGKASLTVTADDKTVSYGDAAPTYTASYSGFVNGETKSVLGGTLSFACAYTSSSNTGTYTITPSGLTSSNYAITFASGTLTVNDKQIESVNGTTVTQDENGYSVTVNEGTGSGAVINLADNTNVNSLTYSRTLTAPGSGEGDVTIGTTPAKLYTTCLPTIPATNANVKYYTLASVSDNTLHFTEVTSPAADTPYLMAVMGSSNVNEDVNANNVTLKKTVTSTPVDGYTMMGTQTGLTNGDALSVSGAAFTYILQSGGNWGKVTANNTSVYIPPFRAYIVGPAPSAARQLDSSFDDATGIDSIRTTDSDGTERWYDLNGRRIDRPTQKGVYIRNGKKIAQSRRER